MRVVGHGGTDACLGMPAGGDMGLRVVGKWVSGLGHIDVFLQGEDRGADPQVLAQLKGRLWGRSVQEGVVGVGLGGQAPACCHHHFCLSKCHPQTLP